MKTITFTCETITPMFLSGADGQTPELRPPSIKGALRFWWRAMNGGDYKALKVREDEIFGSENKRSKLIIRVGLQEELNKGKAKISRYLQRQNPDLDGLQTLDYLSYGTFGNGNDRFFYEPNEMFYITLKYPEEHETEILESFQLLSNFGGLGARSRNGYGSFKVHDLENFELFSKENLINKFPKLSNESLSQFSAFSNKVKLYELHKTEEDECYSLWHEALKELGDIYKEAREEFKSTDKKLRQFIGSPVTVEIKNNNRNQRHSSLLERHSKSFFIKIIKFKEEEYLGTILYLPYDYLNGIDSSKLKGKNRQDLLKDYNYANQQVNNYLSKNMITII